MDEQVIAYRKFLELWKEDTDRVVSENSSNSLFSDLPRALPSPIKPSFRPHEIVPALYLGALHNMQPLQTLHQRISEESTRRLKRNRTHSDDDNLEFGRDFVCRNASPARRGKAPEDELPLPAYFGLSSASFPRGISPAGRLRGPHELDLLISACATALAEGQLELRLLSTSPAPSTIRPSVENSPEMENKTNRHLRGEHGMAFRANNPVDGAFERNPAKKGAGSAVRKGLGRVVHRFTLRDISTRIALLLDEEEKKRANGRGDGPGVSFRWAAEIHDSEAKKRGGGADFYARQHAARWFWEWMEGIRREAVESNYRPRDIPGRCRGEENFASASFFDTRTNRRAPFAYWRLALPVVDEEDQDIRQYFGVVSFIILAVLSGSRGEVAREARPSNAEENEVEGENRARTGETSPESMAGAPPEAPKRREREVGEIFSRGVGVPAVVVHCIAGKSRSVAIVAAFLLTLWLERRRHPDMRKAHHRIPEEDGNLTGSITEKRAVLLAEEYVKTTMDYVQSIRRCACPNPGFVRQLKDYTRVELLKE